MKNVKETQNIKRETYFPWFMLIISVIQITFFYIFERQTLILLFANDPFRRHEVWRFITPMLAHRDSVHLYTNMFAQVVSVGVWVERIYGWRKVSVIYFASVFGGSLFWSVFEAEYYAVGSSGGIVGLITATFLNYFLSYYWYKVEDKRNLRINLVLFAFNMVGLVVLPLLSTSRVSNAAHAGGGLTGALVSFIVIRWEFTSVKEKPLKSICAGCLGLLVFIVVIVNISFPGHYYDTEWNLKYSESLQKYYKL